MTSTKYLLLNSIQSTRILVIFQAITILLLGTKNFFKLSYADSSVRCSHVPPTADQVSHVWLSDANFSINAESTTDAFEIDLGHSKLSRNQSRIRKRRSDSSFESELSNSSQYYVGQNFHNALVPIKIQVHYDSSVYSLEPDKQQLISNVVMPSVVGFFENVLSLRREYSIDRYRISRRCPNNTVYYARDPYGLTRPFCMDRCEDYAICGEIVVPKAHLAACSYCNITSLRCMTDHSSEGPGVTNTQLLLYVSAKQTPRCLKDQTIAYAAHCAQDVKTDRPVAGHANLCPSSISTDPKDLKALIATVKHELTHVLGFSVSLFAYYRDQFGRSLTERDSVPGPLQVDLVTGYARWSDRVIKKIIRRNWSTGGGPLDKEIHMVVTPTVVREVRNHFNCSTLEGAELEDQGSDGTSMTHWEKRLFENEAMTGTHTQNSVYSRITLAVLQDTGWYVANFSQADKLDWGRNLGCDFVKKSCKSWIDDRRASNKSVAPFCDRVKGDLLEISCTDDRTSKAVCNMKQYSNPLPLAYQNFEWLEGVPNTSLALFGGSVDLADYCPFIQEFIWQAHNVTIRGSRCDFTGNNLDQEKNAALEYYGPQTRCFEHGRRWEQRSCLYRRHWHHYGAGCYKYQCVNGHLAVTVYNETYHCFYKDQLIPIRQTVDHWFYSGSLKCPACTVICPASKCKTYDKQIIDVILSLRNQADRPEANRTRKALLDLLDNSLNSVEPNDPHQPFISSGKSKETRWKTNKLNSDEILKYKHVLQLVSDIDSHRGPQSLICSGTGSIFQLPTYSW